MRVEKSKNQNVSAGAGTVRVTKERFPAHMLSLLDKFVPQEKPGKECKPVQKRISGLAAIDLAFHKAMELDETYYERASTSVSLFYDESLAMAGQIRYKPKDIESFSKNLAQYHEQYGNYDEFAGKVGEFISALVNASNSWRFRIVTAGLPFKISSLGAETRKFITVIGDLGDCAGVQMHGGRLTVNGSVGENTGYYATGGIITVNGNIHGKVFAFETDTYDIKGGVYQYGRALVKNSKTVAQPVNK